MPWNPYWVNNGGSDPSGSFDLFANAPTVDPRNSFRDRFGVDPNMASADTRIRGTQGYFNQMQASRWQPDARLSSQSLFGSPFSAPSQSPLPDAKTPSWFQQTPKPTPAPVAAPPATPSDHVVQQSNGALGGAATGNNVVDIAKSFVGKVRYHLGSKPSASVDNPTTWDCSGFIKWLDNRYGNGQLPGGAHYQYQYAQKNGKLFTDMSQLQPGDVIFINTGFKGGAGAWLNPASHVAIYAGNGMMIHATTGKTAGSGTILSPMSAYPKAGKPILGAMHMPWSGGSGGGYPGAGAGQKMNTGGWY